MIDLPDNLPPEIAQIIESIPQVKRPQLIQSEFLSPLSQGEQGIMFSRPIGTTPVTKLQRLLRECRSFGSIFLLARDPDAAHLDCVDGETCSEETGSWIYRPWRQFLDLAELADCYLHLPRRVGSLLLLEFEAVEKRSSWKDDPRRGQEKSAEEYDNKYGAGSLYNRFNRFEEPWVADEMLHAFDRARLQPGDRVLSVGVNSGKELDLFRQWKDGELFSQLEFTGIDIAPSAIEQAQQRLPYDNVTFMDADLRDMESLELPSQNLIMAISVFQSSSILRDKLLTYMVRHLAAERCTFLIGFPDSRYARLRLLQGAATAHNARPDYTKLVKDLRYYSRYFSSHRYRVTLGGRYYVILTASSF
jgi:trans-aconitate methyltransferase